MNHLIPRGLLIGINVKPLFGKISHVPLVLGMVASILASHPLLTRSILDIFPGANCFIENHQTYVIILAIHYIVSLLNVDTNFP